MCKSARFSMRYTCSCLTPSVFAICSCVIFGALRSSCKVSSRPRKRPRAVWSFCTTPVAAHLVSLAESSWLGPSLLVLLSSFTGPYTAHTAHRPSRLASCKTVSLTLDLSSATRRMARRSDRRLGQHASRHHPHQSANPSCLRRAGLQHIEARPSGLPLFQEQPGLSVRGHHGLS